MFGSEGIIVWLVLSVFASKHKEIENVILINIYLKKNKYI